MKNFNGLKPAQAERLALLAEELGEAVQAIGKILRHGYSSTNPDNPFTTSNREQLEHELGDVALAQQLMVERGDIRAEHILARVEIKRHKVAKHLHHQVGV